MYCIKTLLFLRKLAKFETNCQNMTFSHVWYFLKYMTFFFFAEKWYSKRKSANSRFTRLTVEIQNFLVADIFQVCDFLFFYFHRLLFRRKSAKLSKYKFSSRMIIFTCKILLHKYYIISPKSGKILD